MIRTMLLIALGGGIGSVLRYLTFIFIQKFYASAFPLATLITNIFGCFLIGIFVGMLTKNQLADSSLKWFLVTGICGGYTTFSAFGLENVSLFQQHNAHVAFSYIAVSIIVGFAAVWTGLYLASQNW